jgi:hypothetical protein
VIAEQRGVFGSDIGWKWKGRGGGEKKEVKLEVGRQQLR